MGRKRKKKKEEMEKKQKFKKKEIKMLKRNEKYEDEVKNEGNECWRLKK